MAKEQLYEMVVIFDAQGDEADIRREIDLVSSLVEKRSSEFIGKADWGLRNFAYPIKKRTSGQYVYYLFRAGIEVPALLSSALKWTRRFCAILSSGQRAMRSSILKIFRIKHSQRRCRNP